MQARSTTATNKVRAFRAYRWLSSLASRKQPLADEIRALEMKRQRAAERLGALEADGASAARIALAARRLAQARADVEATIKRNKAEAARLLRVTFNRAWRDRQAQLRPLRPARLVVTRSFKRCKLT